MRKKLTVLGVKRIKPKAGQIDYFDTVTTGLALRVSPKGQKSWYLFFRGPRPKDGKIVVRRQKLGAYPALDLGDAREKARDIQREIEKGNYDAVSAARRKVERLDTVASVVDEFFEKYAQRRTKDWKATRGIFERHVLPVWGGRLIAGIERRDLIDLLDDLVARDMPVMANRVLAHVRKLFNWCIERGILEASPAAYVKAPAKEVHRDRVLDEAEICEVWDAFDRLGYPFAPMFKFMLATGQRRDEVAKMTWAEVKGDLWTIPRERAKSDRAHAVPLSPLAKEILESVPHFSGQYVFSGSYGQRAVSGYSHAKQRAEKLCDVNDWRLHDLRRTVATQMAGMGISLEIIGRVLNHAPRGVTAQVYNRHTYLPEKKRALEAWGRKLKNLIQPVGGNVIELPARAEQ